MSGKAHEAASAVTGELVQSGRYQSGVVGDVSWIFIILEIFTALAENCNFRKDPAKSCDDCRRPGLLQKIVLKRICKQVLGKSGWREHGDELFEALLRYGQTLDEAKLSEILEEL